jgi:hypothetical protein
MATDEKLTDEDLQVLAIRALAKPILALVSLFVVLMFSHSVIERYYLLKKAEIESRTVHTNMVQDIKDLKTKIETLERETSNKSIGSKSADTGFFRGSGIGSLPEISPSDKN